MLLALKPIARRSAEVAIIEAQVGETACGVHKGDGVYVVDILKLDEELGGDVVGNKLADSIACAA